MRRLNWILFLVICPPAIAHMVSMSSGELRVEGNRAHYELHMPLFEVAHIATPEKSLLDNIHFASGGAEGQRIRGACHEDRPQSSYVCEADYEWSDPVDQVQVTCTLHKAAPANHVHVLRATKGGLTDEAVFDFSYTSATLRFRPPTAMEMAVQQGSAGIARAMGGWAQLLFLVALALAARSTKEIAALVAMLAAGEVATCLAFLGFGLRLPPTFVESALALTIAYLAVEMLLLPRAGRRWLVVGVLGGFYGLYFAQYLSESGYSAAYVLGGAVPAQMLVAAALALSFLRLRRLTASERPQRACASALLAVGLVWFFVRLRG